MFVASAAYSREAKKDEAFCASSSQVSDPQKETSNHRFELFTNQFGQKIIQPYAARDYAMQLYDKLVHPWLIEMLHCPVKPGTSRETRFATFGGPSPPSGFRNFRRFPLVSNLTAAHPPSFVTVESQARMALFCDAARQSFPIDGMKGLA